MLSVNSLQYQAYEAGNLMNIQFTYVNGTVIPSWLEGSSSNTLLNSAANSVYLSTSTNTIYWLRIYSANFLLAGLSNTLYIEFGQPSTNWMSNTVTGEAPQLSSRYGQFDDGTNVFEFYDGFSGTSINSKWNQFNAGGDSVTQSNTLWQ